MHNGSEHAHVHTHANSLEEARALLTYMLDHNRRHADELHALAHDLTDAGHADAAALLHEGVADLTRGNEKLADALLKLPKE